MDENRYVSEPISADEAGKYAFEISKALDGYMNNALGADGLMKYYWHNDSPIERAINDKVKSAFPSVEVINRKLYGAMNVEIKAPLTHIETETLKLFLERQMKDGYTAAIQDIPIHTFDGDLSVDFIMEHNYLRDTEQKLANRLHVADKGLNDPAAKADVLQFADGSQQYTQLRLEQNYITDKLFYPIDAAIYFYDDKNREGNAVVYYSDEISHTDAAK